MLYIVSQEKRKVMLCDASAIPVSIKRFLLHETSILIRNIRNLLKDFVFINSLDIHLFGNEETMKHGMLFKLCGCTLSVSLISFDVTHTQRGKYFAIFSLLLFHFLDYVRLLVLFFIIRFTKFGSIGVIFKINGE